MFYVVVWREQDGVRQVHCEIVDIADFVVVFGCDALAERAVVILGFIIVPC